MNRAGLIKKISDKENIPVKTVTTIVRTLFDSMRESLKKGKRIEIRGFGGFAVRHYDGYRGRNPKTGQLVDIAPKRLPFFKVGKELKAEVNKQTE